MCTIYNRSTTFDYSIPGRVFSAFFDIWAVGEKNNFFAGRPNIKKVEKRRPVIEGDNRSRFLKPPSIKGRVL